MFGDTARQEIAVFIERDAGAYLSLRSSLFGLQKEIFSDLITRRNEQLTDIESAIEQFALIHIELSESMFNNCYNAQLVAALGIIAWQKQLVTRSLQFCYADRAFENWSREKLPDAVDLMPLVQEAHRQQMSSGLRSLTAEAITAESFAIPMTDDLFAFAAKHVDMLYDLSAADAADPMITDFIRQLFRLDMRLCLEMTAVSLHLLTAAGADERSGAMIDLLQTIESGVRDLAKDQSRPN